MKFPRESKTSVDVNLTPLIDVVFLLLIFFMVSTSFVRESHLAVNLPGVEDSLPLTEDDIGLEVVIDQNGLFTINGNTLDVRGLSNARETLASALNNYAEGNTTQALTIAADATAPYQSVIQVMDVAGQLGFSKLQMATQMTEGSQTGIEASANQAVQ